jgi:hypothetical protein
MPARVLHAGDAHWRPSNQMGVLNTDVGKQLGGDRFAAETCMANPLVGSVR